MSLYVSKVNLWMLLPVIFNTNMNHFFVSFRLFKPKHKRSPVQLSKELLRITWIWRLKTGPPRAALWPH
jgi:glutamate/tyrosine decarboxylase-like PLP-dependent enzyme